MQKKFLILPLVLIIVIVVFVGVHFHASSPSTNTITFHLAVIDENRKERDYTDTINQNETVLDVMKQLEKDNKHFSFATKHFPSGDFITSINSFTPNTTKEFWDMFVNNKESQVGAGSYQVKKNDMITFTLSSIQ